MPRLDRVHCLLPNRSHLLTIIDRATHIFDRTTPLELTNSKHKPIAVSEAAKVIKNKGKINTSFIKRKGN